MRNLVLVLAVFGSLFVNGQSYEPWVFVSPEFDQYMWNLTTEKYDHKETIKARNVFIFNHGEGNNLKTHAASGKEYIMYRTTGWTEGTNDQGEDYNEARFVLPDGSEIFVVLFEKRMHMLFASVGEMRVFYRQS